MHQADRSRPDAAGDNDTDSAAHDSRIVVVSFQELPEANSGVAARAVIASRLEALQRDDSVHGLVLEVGHESLFADAPADVEPPVGRMPPSVASLLDLIEGSRKPVVMVLSGEVINSAFELALACHARVALASASVGFTEIGEGLLPLLGGVQRLTRLAGPETAAAMLLGAQRRRASDLAQDVAAAGVFDAVVANDAIAVARQLATTLSERSTALPLARKLPVDAERTHRVVRELVSKLTSRQKLQPAYTAALDAIDAAAEPFERAVAIDMERARLLRTSTQAQALRYIGQAEAMTAQVPGGKGIAARPVESLAVIGAGTMGTGIAIAALNAGLNVVLLEQDEGALSRGTARISAYYGERVAGGKLRAEQAQQCQGRLLPTTDWASLSATDLIIEAVFEDLEVKQQVLRRMDDRARPDAILATNTSYLDVDAIASVVRDPGRVIGLHFFSPAHVMRLLEVVRGRHTRAEVLATGAAFGVALKKLPVQCGNAFGFVGNRIYNAYRRQCEIMLEDGAMPEDVDNALTAMGFAMGPFAVADMSGLDIAWRMRKSQAATRDARERYVSILDELCEQGRLGRKAGAGYYSYADGRQAKAVDASVRAIVEAASARRGIHRRTLLPAEIQRRALVAMVNEAACLFAEGVASRPSDIDVVLVQGYGFPRWLGGPVFWARGQDRAALEADLDRLGEHVGQGFARGNLELIIGN